MEDIYLYIVNDASKKVKIDIMKSVMFDPAFIRKHSDIISDSVKGWRFRDVCGKIYAKIKFSSSSVDLVECVKYDYEFAGFPRWRSCVTSLLLCAFFHKHMYIFTQNVKILILLSFINTCIFSHTMFKY